MPKTTAILIASAFVLGGGMAVPAGAAVLGPHPAACQGAGPAMLVRVEGLKARTGTVRVQTYGGDPARYFDKGTYLDRVEVRPPATGPVEICMPVPRQGTYAVSVRHDVSGDGKTEMGDGGGMSGNPNLSLMDVVLKRRPSPSEVEIEVHGVKTVRIVLNYVHGTSFGPISGVARSGGS